MIGAITQKNKLDKSVQWTVQWVDGIDGLRMLAREVELSIQFYVPAWLFHDPSPASNGHEPGVCENGALHNQHTKPPLKRPVLFRFILRLFSYGPRFAGMLTRGSTTSGANERAPSFQTAISQPLARVS